MNAALWGQYGQRVPGLRGYLDPKTGIFHPAVRPQAPNPDAPPPVTTNFAGKLVFNFTITVSSAFPATAELGCNAGAAVFDLGSGNAIIEEAGSAVARGSGSTVTCSVTIPYSWNLASSASDT